MEVAIARKNRYSTRFMYNKIELTADGRLIRRESEETPQGMRKFVKDITQTAHHYLTENVKLEEGVRLSSLMELLKANDALCDVYRRNWSREYVDRYDALRSGKVILKEPEYTREAKIEAIVLRQKHEITLHGDVLHAMVTEPRQVGRYTMLNLEGKKNTARDCWNYWDVTGRSVVLPEDLDVGGQVYAAGSTISYSISTSFDSSIDLPVKIVAGYLVIEILGERKRERMQATMPVGTDEEPPLITLGEFIDSLLDDFSFHGGPEESDEFIEEMTERLDRDPEELGYGSAAAFNYSERHGEEEERSQELQNRSLYWPVEIVMEHAGLTQAEIKKRCNQGRMLDLDAYATDTAPSIKAYPAQQFVPGFDVELFRYLNAVGKVSCDDWTLHRFLLRWTVAKPQAANESVSDATDSAVMINGWAALALPEQVIGHSDIPKDSVAHYLTEVQCPIYAPGSCKAALVEALEAYAAHRLQEYEDKQNNELEDE